MKHNKIAVLGYWMRNFGDDLMLSSFLSMLRSHSIDCECFISTPKRNIDYYQSSFGVVAIRSDSLFLRIFSMFGSFLGLLSFQNICMNLKTDYSVYIVGSFFNQKVDKRMPFPVVPFKLDKTFIFGANFGPFLTSHYLKKAVSVFSRCKKVVFRDSKSKSLFANLPNVISTTDLAFCYENWSTKKTNAVLFVLFGRAKFSSDSMYNDYLKKSKEIIEYFSKSGYTTIGLALSKFEGDEETFNFLSCDQFFSYFDNDIAFIMSLFKTAEVVVSSRHHGCVAGLLSNCLVIPFEALPKTFSLIGEVGAKKSRFRASCSSLCFDSYSITKENADGLRRLALSSFSSLIDFSSN